MIPCQAQSLQQSSKYLWLLKSTFWSDAVYFRSAFRTAYGLGKSVRSPEFLKSSRCRGRTSSSQTEQQFAKVRNALFPVLLSASRQTTALGSARQNKHPLPQSICLTVTAGAEPLHNAGATPKEVQQHPPLCRRQWEGKSVLRISLSWEYVKQNIPRMQKSC